MFLLDHVTAGDGGIVLPVEETDVDLFSDGTPLGSNSRAL